MQHRHLFVEFYGWYENQNDIFLAMEYIPYGDLGDYIKDEGTARPHAREMTKQILEALVVLHAEGICHRDLKPQVRLPYAVHSPPRVVSGNWTSDPGHPC